MRVLYDYQIFRDQRYGGISRYFTNLIELSDKDKVIVPCYHSRNYYYNKLIQGYDYKYESVLFEKINDTISRSLTKRSLKQNEVDVFHPTSNDSYFLKYLKNEKVVITIHDLVREKFPDYYQNNAVFIEQRHRLIQASDHIIAVSHNTKDDIMDYYGVHPDKITVVYHGLPIRFGKVHITLRGLPDRYILFVGQRDRHKNFDFFLEAFAEILLEDHSLNLLCVGGSEFSENERKTIRDLGIGKQVKQRNLNDEVLAACYKQALAFVYPSIYEGFGIPILEAFTMGCPVILSDIGCFREVAGEAGIYMNPHNKKDIQSQLRWVLDDEHHKDLNQKVGLGQTLVQNFTLLHTYDNTYDVYEKVLKKNPLN